LALIVDQLTKIITIPKADTTLVDAGPPEIRKYDIYTDFFFAAKDYEDSAEGIPFDDIILHKTTATVGGVTLAHVVEIINGYTITFENGSYRVNTFGANHNLIDVLNYNSVQVTSANSAGLIQIASGSGADWTSTELNQIRHRLGIDGTATAPAAVPSLSSHAASDVIDELESRSYDGVPWPDTVKALLSFTSGEMIETKVSPSTRRYDFYDRVGENILFTLTMNADDGTRVRS